MTDKPVVTDEVEDYDGTIRQYDRNTDTIVATIPASTAAGPTKQGHVTLGGFPLPGVHDARGWHDLAGQRAAAEGIE